MDFGFWSKSDASKSKSTWGIWNPSPSPKFYGFCGFYKSKNPILTTMVVTIESSKRVKTFKIECAERVRFCSSVNPANKVKVGAERARPLYLLETPGWNDRLPPRGPVSGSKKVKKNWKFQVKTRISSSVWKWDHFDCAGSFTPFTYFGGQRKAHFFCMQEKGNDE